MVHSVISIYEKDVVMCY